MIDRRRSALASKLFGSGVVAQACGFLATAFAASRTSPGDFALFAAVTAATAVLGSVNSLAAESRVPVVGRRSAESLNRAGFTAVVVFSAVCALIGGVGAAQGQRWGHVALLTAWCSAGLGLQHLLVGIVLRTQQQELLARNRLVQGISNALLIVALVLAGMPGFYALSVAWGLSMTLADAVLLPRVTGWAPAFVPARRADVVELLDEVRWQPLSNLLSDGVGQIPLLALPALGAPTVSGAWAAANRFLTPIVNMAQITMQPIYYGQAAAHLRERDPEGYERHRRVWSRRLACAAIPVLAGCYVALEWLVPLLGPEWSVSSLAIVPACIVFPMALSWLPISQTLILSGHLRTQFVWTAVQFVLSVIPFALAATGHVSALQALIVWSLVSSGGMLAHRFLQRRPPVLRAAADPADG
ncbi:lipopolysaccharide biosynthesis protein [Agilicoccus flavus]|uniref:lipopolysaccharide biosynthesis protein n=1 Tax=Agilicoccus flavus TaxID=2775968 RepID=UPI001CF6A7C5|nr:hypothetical protein [Agilicoccus flavus]